MDLLLGFHLIVRLSIGAHAAGALLAITFALSAIPDFFIAGWLARKADPVAAALRMQLLFGFLAFLSATLLFGVVPDHPNWRIVYVCVTSLMFRLTYAAFDVSQNALVSLLPTSTGSSGLFVTVKLFASSLGRLAAAALAAWALATENDLLADAKTLAVVGMPFAVTVYALPRVKPIGTAPAHLPSTFEFSHLPIAELALPVVATVCEVGLLGLAGRLMPFFPSEGGGASPSSLIVAMVSGTVIGPWVGFVAGRRRMRRITLIAVASASATWSAVGLLHPIAAGTGLVMAAFYGTGLAVLTNFVWEQVSTIVRDHAERHGTRIDAPAFAVITTAIKVAIAFSAAFFGLFLDAFRQGDPGSAQSITIVLLVGGSGSAVALVLSEVWRKPRLRTGSPHATQVA